MSVPLPGEMFVVRVDRWAQLSVLTDDEDNIVLQLDDFGFNLTINDTLELIERLQTAVAILEDAKAAA